MKRNIVPISLLCLIPACATTKRQVTKEVPIIPVQVPGTTVPSSEYGTLRNGEVIKQYYTGPYVDPNNSNVRHNPHNVQRVEQAATWTLRPNAGVVAGGPTYIAAASAAQNRALTQQLSGELDRQRGYSDALTQQNQKLQEQIEELKQASQQDAQTRTATEEELKLTIQTLKELNKELQKIPQQQQAPLAIPLITPTPKGIIWDDIFRKKEGTTGQLLIPKTRDTPFETPRLKALLETLSMHVAALDRAKDKDVQPNTEDTIDLDRIYAPFSAKISTSSQVTPRH